MNITGIELLHKTEIIETTPNSGLLLLTLVAFAVCLVALLICATTDADCRDAISIICFVILFVGIFSMVLSFIFPDKVPTGRYEYEVYVSENADVVQLYKNYEFVECRGNIYTFRDPEVENDEDSCCDCDKYSYKNECSHHNDVSFEHMKSHNHTHKQKHGCIEENVESENPKAEVPNEPETPAEDIDNVCDNCKSILEENDKFCFQCGHKRKEE